MEVGLRVVRGDDWKWGNQDGGEGFVGTVVVLGRSGSFTSPEKTVIVQWDGGTRTNYRCGHENAYDLFVLDNGPIGVIHRNVSCNECRQQGVEGMLWLCATCQGYTLCSKCYSADKHSLDHPFYRKDSPSSAPIFVEKRQGQQKIPARGTFLGSQVRRGPDWDWGNQDGGPTKTGSVTEVRKWENESFNSVVAVRWPNNETNVYRLGHKGKVDVVCVSPSFGGFYYKNHLPKVGFKYSSAPKQKKSIPLEIPGQPQFMAGDQVRILLEPEVLRLLQKDFGGWNEKMKELIGLPGTVQKVLDRGGVRLEFEGANNASRYIFNPIALSKMSNIKSNDTVHVLNDMSLVKKLQVGHGEWTDNMMSILGKEGKVSKIYSDGDIRVVIDNTSWTLNPAVLVKKSGSTAVSKPQQQQPTQAAPSATSVTTAEEEASLPSLLQGMSVSPTDITSKLISAAGLGQYTRVRDILAANPREVDSNKSGKTALHVTCHQGHVDIVKLLLKAGAQCDLKDNDGDTPLHYAAYGNKPLVASALIQHGANMNILNANKCTPLHVAVNKGHTDMVRVFVKANCDVNLQDSSGNTALHDAITKDQSDIISIIINSNGCDIKVVNQQGFNAFHRAALKGRDQTLSLILSKCPTMLNIPKDDGFTALHLSSLNGHLGPVRTLLMQSGCEVNHVNENHQTALLLAVDKKHLEIVKELVGHGANINLQDDVGDTPLHTAVANSEPTSDPVTMQIVQLLVQHGADTSIRNDDDKSCLDLCRNTDLGDLLRTASTGQDTGQHCDVSNTTRPPTRDNASADPMAVSNACRLCGEPVDCQFQPCGHSVVCYSCSGMFKACFQCKTEVENVIKIEQDAEKECVVCSDLPAEVIFEPCQHKVACTDCSVRMKKCIECQQKITKKITPDGSVMETSQADKYGGNMDSLFYLEAKVRDLEEAQICAICMENRRNVAFLCGHSTCDQCCRSLRDCPMCRQPIDKKITLFG